MDALASASKRISLAVRRAPLERLTGYAGSSVNVGGERQKKLDVLSNDLVKESLSDSGRVAAYASEEEDGGEGMEEEDEEEEGPEGEQGDEEAQQRRLRRRMKREKSKGGKAGKEALGRAARMEPALAREHFLMPEDERVRKEDVPERMAIAQLMQRGGVVTAAEGPPSLRRRAVDDMERHDEAVWVVDRLELPVGYKVDQVEAVAKVREAVQRSGVVLVWHHHLGIYF